MLQIENTAHFIKINLILKYSIRIPTYTFIHTKLYKYDSALFFIGSTDKAAFGALR